MLFIIGNTIPRKQDSAAGGVGGQGERSRAGKEAHTKCLIKLVPTVLSRKLERQKEETLSTGTHLPLDKDSQRRVLILLQFGVAHTGIPGRVPCHWQDTGRTQPARAGSA